MSDPEKSGMMLQGTTAGKKNKIYMTDIFKKLNFKNHSAIVAINYPKTFEIELNAMKEIVPIKQTIKKPRK